MQGPDNKTQQQALTADGDDAPRRDHARVDNQKKINHINGTLKSGKKGENSSIYG